MVFQTSCTKVVKLAEVSYLVSYYNTAEVKSQNLFKSCLYSPG